MNIAEVHALLLITIINVFRTTRHYLLNAIAYEIIQPQQSFCIFDKDAGESKPTLYICRLTLTKKGTIYNKHAYQLLNIQKHSIKLFSLNQWLGIRPAFFTILLLVAFINTSYTQENLIYNGDFEIYSECPNTVSYPAQTTKEIEKCIGWKAPTYGTSDFFHSCATNQVVSIPNNTLGTQSAFNGNGYLGGSFTNYTGGGGLDGYSGIMWWEYIQGQLVSSLEVGKVYRFSMEVSLAEYSDIMVDEIGIFFSNSPISSPNSAALAITPQIIFSDSNHFPDTINWMHLETLYQANGTEKHITIGNFRDNITTDTLRRYSRDPFESNPFVCYMYMDNVQLVDPTWEKEPTNVFTPNDDGVNDLWTLPYSDQKNPKTVTIMNRWGNLIKEGDLNGFQWDGKTSNGEDCSNGNYFFRISNTNIAGFIQLIR